MELKDVLYQAISQYEEKRILSDIAQGESPDTINAIFNQCILNLDKIGGDTPENRGMLAEGLMHYMMTVALIPSQRKTTLESVDIDIAIPDTRVLSTSPEDVIIIRFTKTDSLPEIQNQFDSLRKIQPKDENIWLVTSKSVSVGARTYVLDSNQFTFANIINDLINFTSNKKQSKLKIFRI